MLLVGAVESASGQERFGESDAQAPALREPAWTDVDGAVEPPALSGRSAILVDLDSRTVLASVQPDLVIPPASLTKVVTIDVALTAARLGEVDLDRRLPPRADSWAENQPPGSSLMFLRSGQVVSLRELLVGLAVSSGNDAAVAVAQRVSGSMDAFTDRMERTAFDLGIVDMRFEDASGLSDRNAITARAFARFLMAHLERHPEVIGEYDSVPSYTYPGPVNQSGAPDDLPITQTNRNGLLSSYPGVDGFKTGYIPASGYNLAATAERDGRRLLAVILGVQADSHVEGARLREESAAALLDYGFSQFELVRFSQPEPAPVRVFGAADPTVVPTGPGVIAVSVPTGAVGRLEGRIEQVDAMTIPDADTVVGEIRLELDGVVLAEEPLVVPAQEPGGLLRRIWDAVALAFARLRANLRGTEPPLETASADAGQRLDVLEPLVALG
jgi:D-alanyl-D-alanine carboxypeptidase (penicillin-binding protein 5/6)